jgi:hypothetical protein
MTGSDASNKIAHQVFTSEKLSFNLAIEIYFFPILMSHTPSSDLLFLQSEHGEANYGDKKVHNKGSWDDNLSCACGLSF